MGKHHVEVPHDVFLDIEATVRRVQAESCLFASELVKLRDVSAQAGDERRVQRGERLVSLDRPNDTSSSQKDILKALEKCSRRLHEEGEYLSKHCQQIHSSGMPFDDDLDDKPEDATEQDFDAVFQDLHHQSLNTGSSCSLARHYSAISHHLMIPPLSPVGARPDIRQHIFVDGNSANVSPHRRAGIDQPLHQGTSWMATWRCVVFGELAESNVLRTIAGVSSFSRASLVVGGFGVMSCSAFQVVYDVIICSAFLLSFAAHVSGFFLQSHAHSEPMIDLCFAWLHIFGMHFWSTWRRFASDEVLHHAVQFIVAYESENGKGTLKLKFHIVLLSQILAGIASLLAQPDFVLGVLAAGQGRENMFELCRVWLMAFATPLLVSSVILGVCLFLFICDVHTKDVWRMLHRLQSYGKGPADCNFVERTDRTMGVEILACCEAVEEIQDRLTHTSRRLCLLWAHMVLFATASAFVVALRINNIKTKQMWKEADFQDPQLIYQISGDMFMAGLAGVLCYAAFLKPASVSRVFESLPRNTVKAMRVSNFSIANITAALDFLKVEAVGYRIGTFQINETIFPNFVSFMSVLLSIALIERSTS